MVLIGVAAVEAVGSLAAGCPPYFDKDSPGSRIAVLAGEDGAGMCIGWEAVMPPGAPYSG
jgi:hypothetical protein